jgi:MFS family permease
MAANVGLVQANVARRVPSGVLRWYVLLMMCLVYTLSIADRYVTSTVLESICRELQLSDSGIEFLTGVALAWFYVILGFPISYLIDSYSRRNIISVSVIVWSAMTFLTGLARTFVANVGNLVIAPQLEEHFLEA